MLTGIKPSEIARELGVAPSWVSERLDEFYTEVLFANGLFPPLSADEYEALKQSIAEQGLLEPIHVDDRGNLIDGHHRLRACRELGLEPRYEIHGELTALGRREISTALNASRRHLSRQQKRKLVEAELMANPERSDRRIAALCGVSHPTVATARSELAEQEAAYRDAQPQVEVVNPSSVVKTLATVDCPCCRKPVSIVRDGGAYTLERA